jgi:arginine exporter protein ArgO
MRPFVGDYVNRHIQSDIRATVLSVQSSSSSLVAIVGMAGFGFLLQRSDLLSALIMLGGLSLIVGIWSYHSYKRSVEKERREMVSATQEN